ncbi:neurogenic locus notch homolog protein 2-like [Mercenaria mercenaria]|uniref:neurogenic locus notch homolog protein 2-like n=1 Tax=Mercenaria mercenaria TaxID=6596 RepID=UPI00234F221D|nr:neurogenic locus notch homolog protein 2-like [Mercenaria mercenaria]
MTRSKSCCIVMEAYVQLSNTKSFKTFVTLACRLLCSYFSDLDECLNVSTCQHGGSCTNTAGSYSCYCSKGWIGQRYEIDTDECLNSSRCLTGATCFNNPGSYTCLYQCSEGWTDKPCKTAPPTCFACDYTSSLSFCDSIEHCTGNQTCYLQSFTNTHGHTHYRSGCTDRQTCRQHEHDGNSGETCLHCCNDDFCNSHGCGDNGFPPKQSRGPLCLDCTHVSDPNECDQMTICSSDEMCRIEELPWGDNSIYHLGCASVHDCAVESNSLGKRSVNSLMHRSVPVCTECCHDDFCNQNCTRKGYNQQQIIVG